MQKKTKSGLERFGRGAVHTSNHDFWRNNLQHDFRPYLL